MRKNRKGGGGFGLRTYRALPLLAFFPRDTQSLDILAVLEELLRIFGRYQMLNNCQVCQKLPEAVPKGKKHTFGPLSKLLGRIQATTQSGRRLLPPPSSRGRRGTGSDIDSESDAKERPEVSEEMSEEHK